MSKRGHNDVLKGNEKEFFRRMGAFLDTLDRRRTEGAPPPHGSTTAAATAAVPTPAVVAAGPTVMGILSPRVDAETRAAAPAVALETSRRI